MQLVWIRRLHVQVKVFASRVRSDAWISSKLHPETSETVRTLPRRSSSTMFRPRRKLKALEYEEFGLVGL